MAPPKPKGLGRGLEALLGGSTASNVDDGELQMLDVGALRPGRYQPRTRMDPGALEELADSIRQRGLMQPIIVRVLETGFSIAYEIIAGERRWRAAQLAGLEQVPCLVREVPDEAALAMSLIENIQREDLNALEEAAGIQRLVDEFSLSVQQAADAVGRSRSATSNLLRLLALAQPVKDLMMAGDIEMGHGRALLALEPGEQVQMAHQIASRGLTVRDAERMVRQAAGPAGRPEPAPPDRDLLELEESLSEQLGAQVRIRANRAGAGQVSIRFASLDELDGILARFRDR